MTRPTVTLPVDPHRVARLSVNETIRLSIRAGYNDHAASTTVYVVTNDFAGGDTLVKVLAVDFEADTVEVVAR